MSKRGLKRFLATLLAVIMVAASVDMSGISVYAEEMDVTAVDTQEASVKEEQVATTVEETWEEESENSDESKNEEFTDALSQDENEQEMNGDEQEETDKTDGINALTIRTPERAMASQLRSMSLDTNAVVEYARSFIGKITYTNGNDLYSTDCSGFLCNVYKNFGIDLWPYRAGLADSPLLTNIGDDIANAVPGDILTFSGHVALYAGNNMVIDVQADPNQYRNYQYCAEIPLSYLTEYGYPLKKISRVNSSNSTTPLSNDPQGYVDNVQGGTGKIKVEGWAFDRDDLNAAITMHIYCNDVLTSSCVANTHRKDVNDAYGVGNNHGYSHEFPVSYEGNVKVSIWAINVSSGGNVLLEERTVNVSQDHTPPSISNIVFGEVSETGFDISFSCTDENAVQATVSVKNDDINETKKYTCQVTNSKATTRVKFADFTTKDGDYSISIEAKDNFGNQSTAQGSVSVGMRGKCGESVRWRIKDGTLTIFGTGAMENYHNEKNAPWMSYKEQFDKLVIENGVTSIGNMAFYECSNIKGELEIPSTVTTIGGSAFNVCTGLTGELSLPDGLTSIGISAFALCPFSGNLTIPSSVMSIGNEAFGWCNGMGPIAYIPASVTTIGSSTDNSKSNVFSGTGVKYIISDTDSVAQTYANQIGMEFISSEEEADTFVRMKFDIPDEELKNFEFRAAEVEKVRNTNYISTGAHFDPSEGLLGKPGEEVYFQIEYTGNKYSVFDVEFTGGETYFDKIVTRNLDNNKRNIIFGVTLKNTTVDLSVSEDARFTIFSAPDGVKIYEADVAIVNRIEEYSIGEEISLGVRKPGDNSRCQEFAVKLDDMNYVDTVKLNSQKLSPYKTVTINNIKYMIFSYFLPQENNVEDTRIELTDKTKKVSLSLNDYSTALVKVNGKEITPTTVDENVYTYRIPKGSKATFTIKPNAQCEISKATMTVADKQTNIFNNITAKGGNYTLTVADDTTIEVDAKELYVPSLKQLRPDESDVQPNAKGIPVQVDEEYQVNFTTAISNGGVAVGKYEFKIGSAVAATKLINANDLSKGFKIAAGDANKTLTVRAWGVGEEGNKNPTVTYTFKVGAVLNKVTIKGAKLVKNNPVITQTPDTVMEYALTPNSGSSLQNLEIALTDNENIIKDASFDAGTNKLLICTKPLASQDLSKIATIQLKRKSLIDGEPSLDIPNGLITVQLTAPTICNSAPTVKVNNTTDKSIVMALSLPKNVVKPTGNAGKIWYRIKVTPDAKTPIVSKDPETEPSLEPRVAYIEASESIVTRTINVIDDSSEKLGAYTFNVQVEMLQTMDTDENSPMEENKIAFVGKTTTLKKVKTKTPAYATTLTLKKGTTTVYTGQSDVKIATAVFDNKATYIDLEDSDLCDLTNDTGIKLKVDSDTGDIFMTAEKVSDNATMLIGKHTIEVSAKAPNGAFPTKATIVVDVVQGIEDIQVITPTTMLYLPQKKDATLTVKANLNEMLNLQKPKTAKVEYSITDVQDADGNFLDETDSQFKLISVNKSNGKVTVKKNFMGRSFRVKAKAVDFKGTVIENVSEEIEITRQSRTFSTLLLARYDSDNENWVPVEDLDSNVKGFEQSIACLDDATVIALNTGVSVDKDCYTDYEILGDSEYTVTSSSTGAVQITYANGKPSLRVLKPIKNVKLTAVTTDGGNVKKTFAMNVVYAPAVDEFSLNIGSNSDPAGFLSAGTDKINDVSVLSKATEVTFKGPAISDLYLSVNKNDEGNWAELDDLYNYKLTAGNGGKLTTDLRSGKAVLQTTKEKTTLTLSYTVPGNKKATTKTYTIINESFKESQSVAAPSVKVTGNINHGVTLSITPNKKYDTAEKVIMFTPNAYDENTSHCFDSMNIRTTKSSYIPVRSVDSYQVFEYNPSVQLKFDDIDGIQKGSYKVNVLLGYLDANNNFVNDAKPMTITIQKLATGNMTYKADAAVTLSLKDQKSEQLKGTGANCDFSTENYSTLQNAIINGQSNEFTKYFTLDEATNTISLRDDLSAAELIYISGGDKASANAAKNDRIGFVTYSILDQNGTTEKTGCSKITVSFKANVSSYSAVGSTVFDDKLGTCIFTKEGKKEAAIAYAYSETPGFTVGNNGVIIGYGSYIPFDIEMKNPSDKNSKGAIVGNNKIKMYTIPSDSPYVTLLDDLYQNGASDEEKIALIKKGICVNTTVSIKDPAKATGKVTLDSTKAEMQKMGMDYQAIINFSTLIDADILQNNATVSLTETNSKPLAIEGISVEKSAINPQYVIKISVNDYEQAVANNPKLLGSKKKMKLNIIFDEEIKYKAENFTIEITFPRVVE